MASTEAPSSASSKTRLPAAEPKAKTKTKHKAKPKEEEEEPPWEVSMYRSRTLGLKLQAIGGSHPASTKRLLSTLRDCRASSDSALRRTALTSLVPAAAVGHRGALAAQAQALTDQSLGVRTCAVECLRSAAGGKRPELGGAVAAALAENLICP